MPVQLGLQPLKSYCEGIDLRKRNKFNLCQWECPTGNDAFMEAQFSSDQCGYGCDDNILMNNDTIPAIDETMLNSPSGRVEEDEMVSDYSAEEDLEDRTDEDDDGGTDVDDDTRTVEIDISDEGADSIQNSDGELDNVVDFSELKVTELRDICRENGLDTKGKKAQVVARLGVFMSEMKE